MGKRERQLERFKRLLNGDRSECTVSLGACLAPRRGETVSRWGFSRVIDESEGWSPSVQCACVHGFWVT